MCDSAIPKTKNREWVRGNEWGRERVKAREQCNRYLYSNLLLLMEMYHVEKGITRQDEGLSSYKRKSKKNQPTHTNLTVDCTLCEGAKGIPKIFCQQNFNSFLRMADTIVW